MKILFYNSQVTDPTTQRVQEIAKKNGVGIVGVTETQPPDAKDYVDWMLTGLNEVETTLGAIAARPLFFHAVIGKIQIE